MSLRFIRRLAADELKVGESRVWIDPSKMEEYADVVTREGVRRLIREGVIRKRPPSTPSRGRYRIRLMKRRRGRRKGPGSRKGPAVDEKRLWIARIRAQRRFLRRLRDRKVIDRRTYRILYRLAKGGMFRSVAHLKMYMEDHGLFQRRP